MFNNTPRVRFVPLGGVIGVTKNCYLYEYYEGDNLKDILIVDMGIGFPKESQLGVDFVIPDVSYLMDKLDKIRGICFTHGHEDHISAARFHFKNLGSPPLFASKLTVALLEAKFAEFSIGVKVNEIKYRHSYKFGAFEVEFVRMTHSIPDTTHLIIRTPVGTLYHGSDYKLDITPPYGQRPDFYAMTKAGEEGVLCLMSDCLGSERAGLTASESDVGATFDELMRKTKGKFIMTTFASNISRIRQCVESAIKFNRSVVFLGRSMKKNVDLTSQIGYLNIPPKFVLEEREIGKLPPSRVCVIVTGSQGQFGSGIYKISNGLNKDVKLNKGDTVVFSSDPIPGNDENVDEIIAQLYATGADVVYPNNQDQLHASGHGSQEDMKFLIAFTRPKFLLPVGGDVKHQRAYLRLANQMGYLDEQVFLQKEGETVIFEKGKAFLGDKVVTKSVFVDAYGVGDVGDIVLRDRATLGKEGVVTAIILANTSGGLGGEVTISSRGFVFEKGGTELLLEASRLATKALGAKNLLENKNQIQREVITNLEKFFFEKTGRRPLIVAEVVLV